MQPNRVPRVFTIEERKQIFRQLEFGSLINEELLSQLATASSAQFVRRRRFVYRAGDAADALFSIIRGRIKLCRIEANTGREAVIDIIPERSLFGESALYSDTGHRANSALAYEHSELLRIPIAEFKRGMAEDHGLHDYTLRLMGQRLEHAERRLADFALNAIPARLDSLLADFTMRYGVREAEGVLIDIPLPHREIASLVGSTRESVTVRLNAMRRAGTIEFVNRRILVKRPESLVSAAHAAS